MPIWTQKEGLRCLEFLGVEANGRSREETARALFYKFGGCILGWVTVGLWNELYAKLEDVMHNLGLEILKNTPSGRGSVVHLQVEFDEEKPYLPFKTADSMEYDAVEPEEEPEKEPEAKPHAEPKAEPNVLSSYQYVFGSELIMESYYSLVTQKGDEALSQCLNTWTHHQGFESLYGAIFELYCHRKLQSNEGNLRLRMRIVYKDTSQNTDAIFQVTPPTLQKIVPYPSNDPSLLGEAHFERVDELNYFCPLSSNHPTYDSAVVMRPQELGLCDLNTEEVGVVKLRNVNQLGLLLQMTVSGATGLPRRPKHSVKQYVRKKFEAAFNSKIPLFKNNSMAVTAFMVPTECFVSFLFQEEEISSHIFS